MGMGSSNSTAASTERMTAAAKAVELRSDLHCQRLASSTNQTAIDSELDAYANEMATLFRQMIVNCEEMMGTMSRMMGGSNYTSSGPADLELVVDFMMAAVREHGIAAKSAPSLDDEKALCAAHQARVHAMAAHMASMTKMMGSMH